MLRFSHPARLLRKRRRRGRSQPKRRNSLPPRATTAPATSAARRSHRSRTRCRRATRVHIPPRSRAPATAATPASADKQNHGRHTKRWGAGPPSVDDFDELVFDFEPFIADILPPMSITGHHQSEKARREAIERAAVSAPAGMSHQKLAEKYRTVVCRHWLRGLCMKGDNCEFLHQMDMDRMPVCRWGENCRIKDCPYKHEAEADKPQCVFYQQGFVITGPSAATATGSRRRTKGRPSPTLAWASRRVGTSSRPRPSGGGPRRRGPWGCRLTLCGARSRVNCMSLSRLCLPLSLSHSPYSLPSLYAPYVLSLGVLLVVDNANHHWKIVSTRGLTSPRSPPASL